MTTLIERGVIPQGAGTHINWHTAVSWERREASIEPQRILLTEADADQLVRDPLSGTVDLQTLSRGDKRKVRQHFLALRNRGVSQVEARVLTVMDMRRQEVIPHEVTGTSIRPFTANQWNRRLRLGDGGHGAMQLRKLSYDQKDHLRSRIRQVAAAWQGPVDALAVGKTAIAQLRDADILSDHDLGSYLEPVLVMTMMGQFINLRTLGEPAAGDVLQHYLGLRGTGIPPAEARVRTVTDMRRQGVIRAEVEGTSIHPQTSNLWERKLPRPDGLVEAGGPTAQSTAEQGAFVALLRPDDRKVLAAMTAQPLLADVQTRLAAIR
ncbi:hypothetical protein ACFXKJ_41940, partial [Kitasatospora indigofera]|uniref:hypothetical protein n=1 Tax=Kitasatospora indigofera TaxID=67307 RepID=UPI003699D6C7